MNRANFEAAFDSRTEMIVGDYHATDEPVVIEFGSDIETPAGHLLATSLVNLLARAHQHLVIVGDLSQPLLCPSPFGHVDLEEATAGFAHEIHPWRDIDVVDAAPSGEPLVSIGLGQTTRENEIQIGAEGWVASFGLRREVEPDSLGGAALAACLAAAAAFRRQLGRLGLGEGDFSLWSRSQRGRDQGPAIGPIDVGSVLQVGAGAVGAALDWWLSMFGYAGTWTIADADTVDISNLNRQILFAAADTEFAGRRQSKAVLAAGRMIPEGVPSAHWYGDDATVVDATYDVILPLANERAVRPALQARIPPILLHATTSRHWQAQLHRHVPGRDDCLTCRIPTDMAQTSCSKGEISPEEPDAALPFLSATAGLLLAGELARLSATGRFDEPESVTALDLSTSDPALQRFAMPCREGCASWPSAAIRRVVNEGTRWASLDPDVDD